MYKWNNVQKDNDKASFSRRPDGNRSNAVKIMCAGLESSSELTYVLNVHKWVRVRPTEFWEVFQGLSSRWVCSGGWLTEALVEGPEECPEDALIYSNLVELSSFVLLNKLSRFSVDYGGDCCCQLPLVGKSHRALFGLVNIHLQPRLVTPNKHSWMDLCCCCKGRKDCVASMFIQVGTGLCGSAVRAAVKGHSLEDSQGRCVLHWRQCCSPTLSVGQQRSF